MPLCCYICRIHAIAQNHNAVQQLLKTCLPCDKPKVIDALCDMVTKYLDVQAPNVTDAITQFIGWLRELIEQGLQHVSTESSQLSKEKRASIHNAERILQALNAKKPDIVDEHAQQIVKVVHRFSKEHCQLIQQEHTRKRQGQAESSSDTDVQEAVTRILVMGIQLLSTRLNILNDARKTFLNAITFLIERCPQIERDERGTCLSEVAKIVGTWIADPNSGLKITDKANLVNRMLSFEQGRNPAPYNIFLQMIYEVISNPEPPEPDLVNKVQRAHMIGLRCRDPTMRKRFFKHFESSVVKSRGLYQRLTHIVQKQEWDAIGDSYWLKHAVELILNIANNEVRIGAGLESKNLEEWKSSGKKMPAVDQVLAAHDAFINDAYRMPMSALLEPLCELMVQSNVLAHTMWGEIFPCTWSLLGSDEQLQLSKPLAMLIARDCNKFQDLRRPNVVQGLLEAVHRCKPPPHIPAPILKFAGRTFNAWHSALSILEDQMHHLSNYSDGRKDDGDEIIDALTDLYKRLGEQDVMYGLWSRQCLQPETKVAISYLQYGYWSKAQDTLFNAMMRATQNNAMNGIPKQEKMVWDEHSPASSLTNSLCC